MPLVLRPHGKRDLQYRRIERILPEIDYKRWQAIYPLRQELMQKDALFAGDVAKIKQAIADGAVNRQKGDRLYFHALDAAIRRQRKVA